MTSQISPDTISAAQLAVQLFDIGCVKFGQFKLASGVTSPIVVDLRLLVSHPRVLRQVAQAMAAEMARASAPAGEDADSDLPSAVQFERLAAIPYAGLPIGVAVALETGKPLIFLRKEVRDAGAGASTGKPIEGQYYSGETVLLVDDIILKGAAKIESLQPLLDARLVVQDVLVVIDLEQGGAQELAAHGVALHAVMTLSQMLNDLAAAERLPAAQRAEVAAWAKAA